MVATLDPEQVRTGAVCFFRRSELDEQWGWVYGLSPVHLRLFAVELADAIKAMDITGDGSSLLDTVADWQATAELDAAPTVLAKVREEKRRLPITKFASG